MNPDEKMQRAIKSLADKLILSPEKTETLCLLVGSSSPQQLATILNPEELYSLVASELSEKLVEILNCQDADQTFIDTIVTDIDEIRSIKRELGR